MKYEPPALAYSIGALEPFLSAETLEYHYGIHHKSYFHKLNELVVNTPYDNLPLEKIVARAPPGALFNNAAQAWNHNFYWQCLSPDGGGTPNLILGEAIYQGFGSIDNFRQVFETMALELFGSGWLWLIQNADGGLAVRACDNAGNPLAGDGASPLLVCDLWEHAYYIDYRNQRARYLSAFWDLVNWDFVAANLAHREQYPSHQNQDEDCSNDSGYRVNRGINLTALAATDREFRKNHRCS